MTLIKEFEDHEGVHRRIEHPAHNEVCGLCAGKGSHVNPSIDAEGISSEEFDEDPGFREDYFRGVYDVSCYECGGKRVVAKALRDPRRLTPRQVENLAFVDDLAEDLSEMYAVMAAERRMGA